MLVVSQVIALMQDQAKMLPHVADVVPIVLLTEEAGDYVAGLVIILYLMSSIVTLLYSYMKNS